MDEGAGHAGQGGCFGMDAFNMARLPVVSSFIDEFGLAGFIDDLPPQRPGKGASQGEAFKFLILPSFAGGVPPFRCKCNACGPPRTAPLSRCSTGALAWLAPAATFRPGSWRPRANTALRGFV
jgi:hypothetical protein